MGTKRKYESEEESDADDPKPKKQDNELTTLFKKKVLGNSNAKTPVLVANSKGVVRVDPEQVPNLSSGAWIIIKGCFVRALELITLINYCAHFRGLYSVFAIWINKSGRSDCSEAYRGNERGFKENCRKVKSESNDK